MPPSRLLCRPLDPSPCSAVEVNSPNNYIPSSSSMPRWHARYLAAGPSTLHRRGRRRTRLGGKPCLSLTVSRSSPVAPSTCPRHYQVLPRRARHNPLQDRRSFLSGRLQ